MHMSRSVLHTSGCLGENRETTSLCACMTPRDDDAMTIRRQTRTAHEDDKNEDDKNEDDENEDEDNEDDKHEDDKRMRRTDTA